MNRKDKRSLYNLCNHNAINWLSSTTNLDKLLQLRQGAMSAPSINRFWLLVFYYFQLFYFIYLFIYILFLWWKWIKLGKNERRISIVASVRMIIGMIVIEIVLRLRLLNINGKHMSKKHDLGSNETHKTVSWPSSTHHHLRRPLFTRN